MYLMMAAGPVLDLVADDTAVACPSGAAEAWRRLHEEEKRRADTADGRSERLKREKVQAHCEAQYWKAQWGRARNALEAVRAEAKDLRGVSGDALHLRSEVARLETLLADIGVDTRKRSTIASLRIENGRLQTGSEALRKQLQEVESERDDLRSQIETLSRAQFGRKSEQGRKTRPDHKGKTGGKRGPRPGGETHGRTPRPELARKKEVHDPPPEALDCPCCGAPRVANGSHTSDLIEVAVKAHVRVIDRTRWRKTCQCSDTPEEVSAPPVPRLFPGTAFGISVWTRLLFELCVANRPLRRVAAWFEAQGLSISPGTLSDGLGRMVVLFAPLSAAILEHLQQAPVVHADETSWRVREFAATGSSSRAWLWIATCVDAVYLHVDASRSAAAAATLLGGLRKGVILVCDRYSAYKKLARLAAGQLVLAFCWAHVRRDFIKAAAARGDLDDWKDQWLARIRRLYRLNAQRLRFHDPGRPPDRRYLRMHFRLSRVLGEVFMEAERELATVDDASPQGKVLQSLLRHRRGLSRFLDDPRVPLDNNLAERRFRLEVIRRKLSLGSDSKAGAEGMATMLTVVRTLEVNDVAVLPWLEAWLSACAANGGRPPEDLGPWLPWTMDEARRAEFRA